MRVLYVTSEVFPLVKTGGLADVSAALPAALNKRNVDTRLLLPGYRQAISRAVGLQEVARLGDLIGCGETRLLAARLPDNGVPVWLVDCPALYDRAGGAYQDEGGNEWHDNALRFALLNHVAARIADGLNDDFWRPNIVHAHDWHAALVPLLMATRPRPQPATVLTVHNLAYQGVFPPEQFDRLGLDHPQAYPALEFHGRLSFLKAGLAVADALTTVSSTYANEILTPEYGCGLDGLLRERAHRLTGIMNGVDYGVWDPAHDRHLVCTYSARRLAEKRACKIALQQEIALKPAPDTPLIAFNSRLAHQKMPDIVLEILPALLAEDIQFALVAEGEIGYESGFRDLAARYPGRVSVCIGYEESQAHRLLAGADILLHPSRYEPCGLAPIYAMRYGTLPIVRRSGGMADSVVDAIEQSVHCETATGFAFERPTADDLVACARRALALYRQPIEWRKTQLCAMLQDFSWERPAQAYVDLYRALLADSAVPELHATEQATSEANRGAAPRATPRRVIAAPSRWSAAPSAASARKWASAT
jgi:starch synthase